MLMEPKLLTSDVAKILKCSTDNVRLLERSGQLRADKTEGGVRLFDRKDVDNYRVARNQKRRATAAGDEDA